MDYHDHPFWTERFESGAELRESNALAFTGEDMAGWTEDDFEIADLAMGRDMDERDRCWAEENGDLRAYVRELESALYGDEA